MNTLHMITAALRYWWWRLSGRITVHDLIQAEYDALEPYVTVPASLTRGCGPFFVSRPLHSGSGTYAP